MRVKAHGMIRFKVGFALTADILHAVREPSYLISQTSRSVTVDSPNKTRQWTAAKVKCGRSGGTLAAILFTSLSMHDMRVRLARMELQCTIFKRGLS